MLGAEPDGAEPTEPAPLAARITAVRIDYARCSTATQELQSQLDALEPVCFEVFHEKVSTRVKVWPEYEKAVAMARRFKRLHPQVQVILTVHEFRRLGRGTDLLVAVEDLRKAGIALRNPPAGAAAPAADRPAPTPTRSSTPSPCAPRAPP
ncbi:recombinase family protein [Streptomyces sp. NPDC048751]|uniref:recombinase family protein n=1 Tax=Streptomyces sp. NPDC048751 TaxID=3365591 RepID=UPI00371E05DE